MRGILMAAMLALGVASGVQTSFAADPAPKAKSKDDYLASVRERVSQIDRRLVEVSKQTAEDAKSVTNEVRPKREKLRELVKDASRQTSEAWAEAKTEIDRLIAESERALSRVPK